MSKNDNLSKISAVNNMVDVIKEIVKDELNKQDNTVLCKIVRTNENGSYDVFIEPDEQNIVTNIPSIVDFELEQGDYVYVYKIRNQLNNSFIIKKIGELTTPLSARIEDIETRLNSIDYSLEIQADQSGADLSPFYVRSESDAGGDYLVIGIRQ